MISLPSYPQVQKSRYGSFISNTPVFCSGVRFGIKKISTAEINAASAFYGRTMGVEILLAAKPNMLGQCPTQQKLLRKFCWLKEEHPALIQGIEDLKQAGLLEDTTGFRGQPQIVKNQSA